MRKILFLSTIILLNNLLSSSTNFDFSIPLTSRQYRPTNQPQPMYIIDKFGNKIPNLQNKEAVARLTKITIDKF